MTTKRNQVSVSLFDNRLGGVGLEATRGYNSPFENFPQPLRCDWFLTLDDQHVALDPRLNDVEIGESEPVYLIGNVVEERGRVAIRHGVTCSASANYHR